MSQPPIQAGEEAARSKISGQAQEWIRRAALALAMVGGAYYVGAFMYIAISRIGYPFALEWLEGGSYTEVQRLLTGQPLYARPDFSYVAMIYPPLYYYISAVFARIMGLSYLPLRLVSLASALGALALIYLICRRDRTDRVPALLASGLFAATYSLSGAWFDVARIDMFSVFLLLLSIWMLRVQTLRSYVAAGIVAALAALTKQTHLISVACLGLFLLLCDRHKGLFFVFPFLAAYGLAFLLLNSVYAGWYQFFVFKLALGSGEYVTLSPASSLGAALAFWGNSLLLALPIVLLIVIAWFVTSWRTSRDLSTLFFYATCAIGMIGTSWSVVQVGGYKNDLIPAYAAISILFGLSLQSAQSQLGSKPMFLSAVLAACAIQFGLLRYPIAALIPSQADVKAGQELVAQVRSQPRDVYIPWHPDLALMAGKQPFASWSPMYQLEGNFGGGDVHESARVKTQFSNAMAGQQFGLIILDQEVNWIWGHPERYYTTTYEPVFSSPDVFWPVAGWATRPTIIMVPNGK